MLQSENTGKQGGAHRWKYWTTQEAQVTSSGGGGGGDQGEDFLEKTAFEPGFKE